DVACARAARPKRPRARPSWTGPPKRRRTRPSGSASSATASVRSARARPAWQSRRSRPMRPAVGPRSPSGVRRQTRSRRVGPPAEVALLTGVTPRVADPSDGEKAEDNDGRQSHVAGTNDPYRWFRRAEIRRRRFAIGLYGGHGAGPALAEAAAANRSGSQAPRWESVTDTRTVTLTWPSTTH